MNEFDDKLMQRMERVDAPEGFADRVMMAATGGAVEAHVSEARHGAPVLVIVPARAVSSKVVVLKPRVWWVGAVAAVLLLGVLGGEQVHRERVQQRQMEAKRMQADREFDTAERITDQTMERMRQKLAKAGIETGE